MGEFVDAGVFGIFVGGVDGGEMANRDVDERVEMTERRTIVNRLLLDVGAGTLGCHCAGSGGSRWGNQNGSL